VNFGGIGWLGLAALTVLAAASENGFAIDLSEKFDLFDREDAAPPTSSCIQIPRPPRAVNWPKRISGP